MMVIPLRQYTYNSPFMSSYGLYNDIIAINCQIRERSARAMVGAPEAVHPRESNAHSG